ncbi:DUF4192 family protein [Paramicrobacterium sp. CJ85]|uniref:DUF4192 family protein n=1 Tax=Paramicrobacterium sp. CJ85 TaxID=3445355 RepID=UPI003F605E91
MTSPTRVTLASAAEFLSLVPALVGMEPTESIVCVAFQHNRTHGAVRLDLGGFLNPDTRHDATMVAVKTVTRIPRVTGVAVIVYTDQTATALEGPPCAEIARELSEAFAGLDIDIIERLWRAHREWGSYELPTDIRSCDELSIPAGVPEVAVLDVATETRMPKVAAHERDAVLTAADRFRADVEDEPISDDELIIGSCDLLDPVALSRTLGRLADEDAEIGADDLGLVVTMLESGRLRDVMTYSWAWGEGPAAHLWTRLVYPESFNAPEDDDPWMYALGGRIEVRPDVARLRRAIELLKRVSAILPECDRAPALTVITWCYWALGLASIADVWLRRAAASDPTYSFANIMRMMLDGCVMPDWAFFDPGELRNVNAQAD